MSSKNSLKDAKKSLRQTITSKLSALSEEEVAQQSHAAQKALLALSQYEHAKRICIYLSMPTGEARTETLVRDALGKGKVVFVPYIYKTTASPASGSTKGNPKRSVMEMLRLKSIEEWDGLKRDSWGIPSLNPETLGDRENAEGGFGLHWNEESEATGNARGTEVRSEGLDFVVMPGVAFDRGMNRIGHGAGFYDSYLSRICGTESSRKPYLVGLCLAEQLVSGTGNIPVTDHDWRVDAVAVGDGSVVTSSDVA